MTAAEDIAERRVRCAAHLARLRLLAAPPAGEPFSPAMAEEISQQISLILAEAAAATQAVVSAAAGSRRRPVAGFLGVRLDRLMSAATEIIDAVKAADAALLHRNVRRFEALTSAMWAVELAMSGREVTVVRQVGRETAVRALTDAAG
jgi:hypothetical protein